MSYDDPKTLSKFAKKRGVTFPLLSDPGSQTIDAYGVRNESAKGSRIDGVPHPTTFIVDQSGIVRAKLYEEGYKDRHAPDAIVESVTALKASP